MAKSDDKPGIVKSILGGVLFTLVLLIIVPAVCGHFLSEQVVKLVGDTTLLTLSSAVIVNLIMWIIIIGFTFALGGGRILKKYGVFGIAGLIVAYWLLDNLMGAVYAIATLLIVSGIIYLIKSRSDRKKNAKSN
jgi:hypothetical protein